MFFVCYDRVLAHYACCISVVLSTVLTPASAQAESTVSIVQMAQERPLIVILGEWHGTREAPALIEQLAEDAIAERLSVRVLLEQPATLNAAYSRMTGQAHDRTLLCDAAAEYFARSRDGRATVALAELALALGHLSAQGSPVAVSAMDVTQETPFAAGTPPLTWRRDHMARMIASVAPEADLTLVIVGNNHPPALKRRLAQAEAGFEVLTLRQAWDAGEAWNCQRGQCAVHRAAASSVGPEDRNDQIQIRLDSDVRRYDGYAYVGPITASQPIRETNWCKA